MIRGAGRGRWVPALCCLLSLLAVGGVRAQETPPPEKSDGLRRLRDLPDLRAEERGFPDDTPAAAIDTTPRIDIEARRAALTEGDFPPRDSLFRALQQIPGFHVIEYRGREVRLGAQVQSLGLFGEAQVNRGRDVMTADTIRYLGLVRFMAAAGNIELVSTEQQVVSDSVLYYDVAGQKGTVYNAETQFMQRGANWRVIGNVIPKAQDTVFATHSRFTSCEIDEPHYSFRANRIKMVNQNVIVAWPVVLYVSNVPVFWLPFFASDIRPGRRSGIIPPRFGFNDIVQTDGGASRAVTDVGYYWAINDYLDAQATLDWFSGNFTRVNGAFRYRWLKKFIRGSALFSRSWDADGSRNLLLNWNHDQELGLNTTLRTSVRYVKDTRLLQDQEFDPRLQTQTIDSDAGLNHRFSFANVSVSGRRRQFLTTDRVEETLPSVNISFSPVTLFPAPRTRQGLFNNITLSGSGSYSRRADSQDLLEDRSTNSGSASSAIRLRDFNVSGSAQITDLSVTPEDSTGLELPSVTTTTLRWNARADYQFNLIGSTTLRPSVAADGSQFKSADTGGEFVSAPTRASFGATLSTDIFGFYPGFGPFSRVRHKFSPGVTWAYAPEVTVDSALAAIPGFPLTTGAATNTLTLSFRQTFEAKMPIRSQPVVSQQAESGRAAPQVAGQPLPFPDSLAGVTDSLATGADTAGAGARRDPDAPPARRPRDDRIVTLLSINTSTPLRWDFEASKRGESTLQTQEITNSLSSDLLRGFTINMTHDLFEGTGPDRRFSLALTRLSMSFRLRSGQSFGDLIGLGGGTPTRRSQEPQSVDARLNLQGFERESRIDPFDDPESGPWDLSLRYSLIRPRQGEPGIESQTVDGTLSFHPTPKWSVRWSTQYNFTQSEFGQQLISLDRDLHRWRASFQFARSPNGNVIFQVSVSLRDAPELHGDYNQRTSGS